MVPRLARLPNAAVRMFVGPIFQREVRALGRRRAPYWVRAGYTLLLLGIVSIVFFVLWDTGGGGFGQQSVLEYLAPAMLATIATVQMAVLALIAPVLTAGGIADEKRQRTLPTLLTTPLTSRDIILGKLGARTVQLVILALVPTPLLLALRVFGGVEAEAIVASVALSLAVGMLGAALALMFSIWHRRTPSVVFFALCATAVLVFLPWLGMMATEWSVVPNPDNMFFKCIAPIALFAVLAPEGMGGPSIADVREFWVSTLIYLGVISTLVVAYSILTLRRTLKAEGGTTEYRPEPVSATERRTASARTLLIIVGVAMVLMGGAFLRQLQRSGSLIGIHGDISTRSAVLLTILAIHVLAAAWAAKRYWRLRQSLSQAREIAAESSGSSPTQASGRDRVVGDRPVLWRELRQSALGGLGKNLFALGLGLAILLFLYALAGPGRIGLTSILLFIAMLSLTAQVALSTPASISAERDAGSWGVLLTTPVKPWQVVLGKTLGSIRRLWLIPAIAGLHLLVVVLAGWFHPLGALHAGMLAASLVFMLASTGVCLGLICRRGVTASVLNMAIPIVMFLGLPMFIGVLTEFVADDYETMAMLGDVYMVVNPFVMLTEASITATAEVERYGFFLRYQMLGTSDDVNAARYTMLVLFCAGIQCAIGASALAIAIRGFDRWTGRPS